MSTPDPTRQAPADRYRSGAIQGKLGQWLRKTAARPRHTDCWICTLPTTRRRSDAAAEAGALVGATLEHATGGVMIAFAEVLDDA